MKPSHLVLCFCLSTVAFANPTENAMVQAIRFRDVSLLRELISSPEGNSVLGHEQNESLLFLSVKYLCEGCLNELLGAGAPTSSSDQGDPLTLAVLLGRPSFVEPLLRFGAQPHRAIQFFHGIVQQIAEMGDAEGGGHALSKARRQMRMLWRRPNSSHELRRLYSELLEWILTFRYYYLDQKTLSETLQGKVTEFPINLNFENHVECYLLLHEFQTPEQKAALQSHYNALVRRWIPRPSSHLSRSTSAQ